MKYSQSFKDEPSNYMGAFMHFFENDTTLDVVHSHWFMSLIIYGDIFMGLAHSAHLLFFVRFRVLYA